MTRFLTFTRSFFLCAIIVLATMNVRAINHNPVSGTDSYPTTLSLSEPSASMGSDGKVLISVTLNSDGSAEALTTQPVDIVGVKQPTEEGGSETTFTVASGVSASGPVSIPDGFDPQTCGCNFKLKITNMTEGNGESTPTEPIPVDAGGGDGEPSADGSLTDGGGGAKMEIGMGMGDDGKSSSGKLSYNFTSPDEKMYTPEGLTDKASLLGATVVRSGGVDTPIRQVMAPNRVTDIQTISPQKYQIRSYDPAAVTGTSGGLYVINPSATPQRTVTVENPGATTISGTTEVGLYYQVRWGQSFRYDLPVDNNRYKIALGFIEFHKDVANANTFNVVAEGVTKLTALDIRNEAGARYTVLSKEISTLVSDASLGLEFKAVKGGAQVATIKVMTDAIPAVANTSDPDLYQTARTGDFSYNLSLPNGSYELSLHFVEPVHDVAAARLFDVSVEGTPVLAGFDIRTDAGARDHAQIKVIPITLTDGTLDIDFLSVTDKARLCAVVVRDATTHAVVTAINAGGPAYTAADSTAFLADTGFTSGTADFPGRVVLAINVGGKDYTAADSTIYAADHGFKGGKSFAGAFNRLVITTQQGSETAKPYDYTWVANPETGKFDELILSHAGGLKKESRIQTWSSDGLSYDEAITIYNPDNQPVSKVVTTYEKFPFGLRKVREVRDPEGTAPVASSWSYVEGPANPADPKPSGYGRVKREVNHLKGWTDYTYDDSTRTYTVTRGSMNSAPGTLSGARVETNTYADTAPRVTRVTTVDGLEISRSWTNEETTGTTRISETRTATVPGAPWSDTTNLVSINQSYTSDETDPLKRNQAAWSKAPDSTMTFYGYSEVSGDRVVTRDTGAPNGGSTAILAGTRTITKTNAKGQQIAQDTLDIATGLVLSSWEALEVDTLGRPIEIGYGDGTTRALTYVGSAASCGSCSTAGSYLVESETDRNGVTTNYTYDALNRRTETIRLGVTEKLVYNAADKIVERLRIGTSGPAISQSKITYDLAGRMVATEDALGNVTDYAYVYPTEGGLVTTVTSPAAISGATRGTRIETNYADGRTKEISGTAVSPVKYAYGTWSATGQAGEWTQEIKVGDASAETEWTKTYTDFAHRTVKMEYPATSGTVVATMSYNALGQLEKQSDLDGVQTLFAYNAKGEREVTAVDLDQDGVIDYTGIDRIAKTVRDVYSRSGTVVNRSTTKVWTTDGSNTATTVSVAEQDGYGNASWQTDAAGAASSTVIARTAPGAWAVTAIRSDGSRQVQTYASGRLISSAALSSSLSAISSTAYAYDAHNRVETQTDARTGDTDYTYTDRDEVHTVTANNGTETTTYTYDALGNQHTITRPDSSVTTNDYHLRNRQLKKTSGSQTYPVEYTYDLQGRMKTLTTWQNATSSTGAAVTTWNYDSQRGWLTQKLYADSTGPSYTYKPSGRLLTRTWVRTVASAPLVTTYGYNNAGSLATTDYSDATPDVAITYTRFGAQHTVTDATGTRTFTYTAALRPDQEQLPSFYGDRILTRGYQVGLDLVSTPSSVPGRNNGFTLGTTGDLDQDYDVVYGYDTSGRLGTVTDPNGTFTYGYVTNSNLRHTVTGPVHVATTTYESYRNVIDTVENKVGGTTVSKFDYTVNNLGQRTQRANTGTAFGTTSTDVFTYNTKGEVESVTNATLTARDQSFAYDDIGNRKTFTQNSGTTSYTANALNAYTAIGASSPTHDADGNQTSTGTGQVYVWDAENRLVLIEPVVPSPGDQKQLNVYDAQSRRVRKQVSTYASGSWSLTTDEKFIYDGWDLVAVLDAASSNALLRTYTWGMDLSGSMQGAGGVGGLLSAEDGSSVYHYTYDANGNVSEVLNGSGGIAAHYEYDAFGNTVAASGTYAATNAYRFSTKPLDSVSDLYYYGFRYYNPSTGRWPSRDPIGERGGLNLYGMVRNNTISTIDLNGLYATTTDLGGGGSGVEVDLHFTPNSVSGMPWAWEDLGASQGGLGGATEGATRRNEAKVKCACSSGQVKCDIKVELSIILNFRANLTLVSFEIVYGHEQLHVLSYKTEVERIAGELRLESSSARSIDLMQRYSGKLDEAWQNEVQHSNPNSPPDGGYASPLDGVFPAGPPRPTS
jgi:RHS repeat-associated protein